MRRASTLAAAVLLITAQIAPAQSDAPIARVRGVAFDSLRGKPLADAFVALVGGEWSAMTDSLGRFSFERVLPGRYQVTLHHGTLDTLGFSGLSQRVAINDGTTELRVAVPSFATLWRRVCGAAPAPADSGIVYGTVRNAATNAPVADARMGVTWYDSIPRLRSRQADLVAKDRDALDKSRRKPSLRSDAVEFSPLPILKEEVREASLPPFEIAHWRLQVRTDENGAYVVCGVPVAALSIRVNAATGDLSSDSVDVELDPRVRRRDIRVGPTKSREASDRGTIVGVLTDNTGRPFPYARVITSNARETRSNDRGEFILRDVTAGTRRLDIRYIGLAPAHAIVEVVAGDTATVNMRLTRIPVLPGMRAREVSLGRVLAAEFDARRKVGLGYIVDSTVISKHTSVVNVLRTAPSLNIVHRDASLTALVPDGRGGNCTPTVWMDGVEAAYGHLFDLQPSEVMGLEVYTRALSVPAAFAEKGGAQKCGVILVWTRYAFRNR